jgi:hypothetical protein
MVVAATDELTTAGAVALCGGIALYLLGHAIFRLRTTHSYGIIIWPQPERRSYCSRSPSGFPHWSAGRFSA